MEKSEALHPQQTLPLAQKTPQLQKLTIESNTQEIKVQRQSDNKKNDLNTPTRREMYGLDESFMTLYELKRLLFETNIQVKLLANKQSDSVVYSRILSDIEQGYNSRYLHLEQILESPQKPLSISHELSADAMLELKNVQQSYYDFFRNVWCMKQYLNKLNIGFFPNTSVKRRKVLDQAYEVQTSWTNLNLNLTFLVATSCSDIAKDASIHVNKLAVASGELDFGEISPDNARTFYIQGEKYFLGFGVEQNYNKAFQRYQKAASADIMEACQMLATMFESGLGTGKDIIKALEWYIKAADLGSVESINSIGKIYETGYVEIPMDTAMAKTYYEKAVCLGNTNAMYNLGYLLMREKIPDNLKKASELYQQAAEHGHTKALTALGCCYYNGVGVAANYEIAVKFYRQAAEKGCAASCNNLGICYEEGKGVPKDLGIAKTYYQKASLLKHSNATSNLAFILWTESKYKEAFQQFNISYSLGCAEAAYQLGIIYQMGCNDHEGFHITPDAKMALLYYSEAIKKDHSRSHLKLGILYLTGPENIRNTDLALFHIHKAAQLGNVDAMTLFGRLHLENSLLFSNDYISEGSGAKAAFEWYKKAIAKGSASALFYSASLYENGEGVDRNMQLAVKMYKQSLKLGFQPAQEKLDDLKELGLVA